MKQHMFELCKKENGSDCNANLYGYCTKLKNHGYESQCPFFKTPKNPELLVRGVNDVDERRNDHGKMAVD